MSTRTRKRLGSLFVVLVLVRLSAAEPKDKPAGATVVPTASLKVSVYRNTSSDSGVEALPVDVPNAPTLAGVVHGNRSAKPSRGLLSSSNSRATAHLTGSQGGAPRFVENRGQFDNRVKFQLKARGQTLWLTYQGVMFDLYRSKPEKKPHQQASPLDLAKANSPLLRDLLGWRQGFASSSVERDFPVLGTISGIQPPMVGIPFPFPEDNSGSLSQPNLRRPDPKLLRSERLVFSEEFIGARRPLTEAERRQPGTYNYFIGNDPQRWVTDVHGYSEVLYRNVWDGIDVRLVGNGSSVEQEFLLRPGADPNRIQVAYEGIDGLELAKDGSLTIRTAFGELRESKPRIYQEIAGRPVPVEGRFKLTGETAYTFEMNSYQPQYALVIDPTLSYSTFLGGSAGFESVGFGDALDDAFGIAVDSSGSAYVAGLTGSTDFPITTGSYQSTNTAPTFTVFVTKLSPDGSQLVYSTYLGGTDNSLALGIALDSAGEAYVAGAAGSGFPTTANAFQQAGDGVFVSKLSATGDALLYSTYLGSGSDLNYNTATGIAVDSSGVAYITGTTTSAAFPTTKNTFQSALGGSIDAFVSVVNPSTAGQASLVYSTYLGGSGVDGGAAIAVDSSGDLYITGATYSSDFPVTAGAYQTSFTTSLYIAFLAKLNPSASGPSSLVYSTFVGGSWRTQSESIVVDSSGNAYVTGETEPNSDSPFPTTPGAFQTSLPNGAGNGAFVTKVNPSGDKLVYSTLLGLDVKAGSPGSGIALDASNNAYVVGATSSAQFPTTPDAFQSVYKGGNVFFYDASFTVLNPSGSALIYSTFLGGTSDDVARGVALDPSGNAYVAGYTLSADFPITPLAFQKTMNGSADAFIAKFSATGPGFSISGLTATTGGNSGTVTPTIVGAGFDPGATVKLGCSGQADIVGTNVVVGPEGTSLTATFNLVGTAPGKCDVVVSNSGGASVTDSQAFTIEQGGAAQVWVDLIGLDKIRIGQPQTYYAVVGNSGNVDPGPNLLAFFVPNLVGTVSGQPSQDFLIDAVQVA